MKQEALLQKSARPAETLYTPGGITCRPRGATWRRGGPVRALFSLLGLLLVLFSCHYPRPDLANEELSKRTRDSLKVLFERHYTFNTNLEAKKDTVVLTNLLVMGAYDTLYAGDRVVVAEVIVQPADSIDSIWVKVAHSQEVQGWIRESQMIDSFVPTDSISQAIYLFSKTHASYFVIVFALFVGGWLLRMFGRQQLRIVFFNDIDSLYPLLLCLLMAFSATIYESIQVFAPETWEHFYFNPTLSPFQVPFVLSLFLFSLWLFVVVLLAMLEDLFRQLAFKAALFYLLGLMSCCIFCYFFFILTTYLYVGYFFLLAFAWFFLGRLRSWKGVYGYRCGHCGARLQDKGRCLACGAINE